MPALPDISSDLIQKYQEEISKNTSVATAKRKSASLNKFFGWAQAEGHIDANPMPSPPPSPNGNYSTINPKSNKNIGLKTWAILGTTLGIIILIFLLTWKLKFPIQFINNMAANIGGGTVTQAVPTPTPASAISANPTENTRWNLYANLKLTDATGAPQVGSQTITFNVYNTQNGGSPLYSEGPQTITTDSNGSVLISLDQVPSDLFFQNRELFLEPEIGSVAASSRIPISTANIAANLGGYFPANPDTGATELTIPVVDENGSLNLASTSPAINAKAGTLLVQGQAVTVKSVDGGNGNIEINPDGSGIAHFLFEGSTGNFLNAQAPNLNSGSLYYGVVANNAAGYYLLKLQSGSSPITRFSVDALGNTSASGNINAGGDLQTAGVSRVSTAGALENITGYSQNSGNFTINQKPGDFASILKTGSALSNAVNITLDERTAPNASDYAALVLRRYNGNNDMALLVDVGNAQFNGQIRLGRFDTNPGAMGTGSLIYNATDNKVYVWDGSAWTAVGTSSISFDHITSGINTTATMVVDTGASLTYSGTGTINATTLNSITDTSFLRSDTSDNYTSGTLTTDAGTTLDINGDLTVTDPNIAFDAANTTFSVTGDLTLNIGGGDLILSDTQTINIGGNGIDVAYNAIADSVAGASANMVSDKDLYVQGNLEVDGTFFGNLNPGFTTGSVIFQGASGLNQDNTNFFWDDGNNRLGIGTSAPSATIESLSTTEQLRLSYDVANYTSFTTGISGNLTIAPIGSDVAISSNLDVAENAAIGSLAGSPMDNYGLIVKDSTDTISGVIPYYGIYSDESTSGAASDSPVNVYGVMGRASAGTLTHNYTGTFTGVSGQAYNIFSNTLSNAIGLDAQVANFSNGTILNAKGLNIQNPANAAGTINSNYGVYVNAQTAGATDVGIYIADADTYSLQLASTDGDTASGITFGTDTNLYRSNSNILTTDDTFNAVTALQTGGTIEALRNSVSPQRFLISSANDLNVPVLYVDANGQITMNAQGAQAVRFNYDKGTGGVIFGTGAGATAASIASNGDFTTIGDAAINGGDITSTAATLTINAGGNVDVQDALNADSITSDAGVSIAASNSYTGVGAVTLSSGGAGNLTLDSASNTLIIAATDTTLQRTAAGTYTIDLVDGSDTTLALTNSGAGVANLTLDGDVAVNGGNITSTGTLDINSATNNAITLDSGTTGAVNIGNNANAKAITIGNTTTTTTVNLTKGATGNIVLTSFNCTGYTNGGKLTTDALGNVTCTNDVGGTGSSVRWSDITSPINDVTLAMGAYKTIWNWDSLTTDTGLTASSTSLSSGTLESLSVNSTAAASNTQKVLSLSTAGANAVDTQTTYGLYTTNTHTGTASTNVGGYFSASGGTPNNYAAIFDQGNVGIGTTTPTATLNVVSGVTDNILLVENALGADLFKVWGPTGYTETAGDLVAGGYGYWMKSFAGPQRFYLGYDATSTDPSIIVNASGGVSLYANGTQPLLLNTEHGGNIGIGDTTPLATLTVGNGDLFQVAGATGNITTAGDLAVNGGDITTAAGNLTLQPAGAATIANVQIGVGGAGSTTPDFLGLDVKSDTGDPAGGFEGAMYYNTFDNKFRCYQGAAWADCIGTSGGPTTSTLQDVYNNDADGGDAIIALTTADDSLIFRNPAASGTDSTFLLKLDQLANAAIDGLQIAQAGTGAGLNMNFTNAGTTADGIIITSTNALTDAIDLSDADIVNAINVGSNVILGTAGVIDFTNFDVATTGHVTVQPGYGIDTNAAGELKLGDTTATTVSIGGTAATTLSLGAGGSLIRTIDIGTGTGADTINVGTNAGSANTIAIGTGAVANAITIGTTTASSALALNDDNWNITGGGLANFVSVGAATPGTGAFTTLSATPTSNVTALTLTGTNVSSANLAYFNSNNTSGTIFNTAYGAGTTLAGALIGSNLDLSTNLTATGYGITGQSITLPAVTNTGAGTYAYKGLAISSGGALIQNTGAGTDTWTGLDVTMPNITQTTGSVTSTGLKITGGTVTSGTSYALTTDTNAGNVGIGTTGPIAPLQIAGSPAGTTQYGMYLNTTLSGTTQNFGGRIAPTFNAVASSNNYGLDVRPQFAATSGGPQAVYYGVLGIPVITADASVNVTSAMAGYFRVDNLSTAGSVLGTAYGLYVAAPTATGTVSNTYALVTAAAAGNVGIGDLTPDHKLDVAGNIGLDAGGYINWGDTDGTSGYGFWDNGGTIEYKNSGGSWAAFGSGSSNWTLNTTDGTLYPINSTVDVLMGATSTASAKFAFTNMNTGTPVFQTTGVIHTGSIVTPTTLAYNQLGPTATTHTLTSSSDLLISGKGEINGVLYLNGRNISSSGGTSTIVFPSAPTAIDSYNLLTNGSWLIQNPASGGNPGIAALMVDQNKGGDILSASTSGVTKFTISNAGNVTIRPGTPGAGNGTMLTVGDGTGKIDAGTYDPVYNIDGTKYATYLSGMTGVKEETTGTLQTSEYIAGVGYRQVLDFKDLGVGSDLWLFSQATDVKNNIGQMVVLLSPTDNTRTWYQIDKNNYTLSVYSDRPTQVSYRLSAPRFDAATWGNYNDNPNSVGFEIHSSDLTGGSTQTPNGLSFADFEIVKNIESNAYKLYQNIADGGKIAIEEFGSFANLVAGNIKAGAVNVENIIAQNTQTTLISPIPGGTDVTVQIGSTATPSGKFAIQNSTGAEVASIDDTGNATFSGTVHSQNIDAIQKLLTQVSTDQSVLLSATAGANLNATGSATISELITNDLYVTGQAAINSLSVTKTITIGSDMIFGSEEKMVDGKLQIENTLNSLSTPLQIQSLAMAPIQIMAGLVMIDTHGNVQIAGDLVVAGKIRSSGLTIQDASGTQVAQVDATGSASFRDLAISGLAIASDSSASDSAVINGVIETNATAGKAIIPAGVAEITIKNPKVSDYTLIYITPTSSTLNNVLYVKSKETGQFIVGFTGPISQDVSFNWWIIEAK
jgi:hypothetical protein